MADVATGAAAEADADVDDEAAVDVLAAEAWCEDAIRLDDDDDDDA